MLPTFIGIGPGRTGTSMLYELLLEHPEVSLANGTKETSFFTFEYHKGINWYQNFFRSSTNAKAIGEISTSYFYDERAPERICEILPKARLFTCLRDPYERLHSVYIYRKRSKQIPHDMPLEKALSIYPDLIYDNCYYTHLNRYFSLFPKEQICVLLYDDLVATPQHFVQKLLSFIGANPDFTSTVINQRINASSVPRSQLIGYLAAFTANSLRKTGFLRVLDILKRSSYVRKTVLKPTDEVTRDPSVCLQYSTLQKLREVWEPQIRAIEQVVGRSLQHWLNKPYENILASKKSTADSC